MSQKTRPLTASLHTVTAVTRVAVALAPHVAPGMRDAWTTRAEQLTREALAVLGYTGTNGGINMLDPKIAALWEACRASVERAIAGGAK